MTDGWTERTIFSAVAPRVRNTTLLSSPQPPWPKEARGRPRAAPLRHSHTTVTQHRWQRTRPIHKFSRTRAVVQYCPFQQIARRKRTPIMVEPSRAKLASKGKGKKSSSKPRGSTPRKARPGASQRGSTPRKAAGPSETQPVVGDAAWATQVGDWSTYPKPADGASAANEPPTVTRIPTRRDEDAGWADVEPHEAQSGAWSCGALLKSLDEEPSSARSSNDGLEGWDATPRGGFRQASLSSPPATQGQ